MLLMAQVCEPKRTEVGVVTTDQLMHNMGEDVFANIQLLKSESNPPLKELGLTLSSLEALIITLNYCHESLPTAL